MAEKTIEIKVTAGARQRSITEERPGIYKIKTPVAPEKGKANRDIVDILAKHFKVPRSAVEILSGHGKNRKKVKIIAQ
jgi:uncharacterized protein (TIGR00251 family)